MKSKISWGSIALAASLLAMSSAVAAEPAPPFTVEDVAWAKGHGPGIVDGVAARRMGDVEKTCAGEEVYLRPRSPYEDYRNQQLFKSLDGALVPVLDYLNAAGENGPSSPKEYEAASRRARCSIDGKFLFAGLAPGDYYAIVMIFPREFLGKVTPIERIEVAMRRISVVEGPIQTLDLLPAK